MGARCESDVKKDGTYCQYCKKCRDKANKYFEKNIDNFNKDILCGWVAYKISLRKMVRDFIIFELVKNYDEIDKRLIRFLEIWRGERDLS